MPVQTPAGPITTLDELRSDAGAAFVSKFPGPVLVVRAPPDTSTSTVVSGPGASQPRPVHYLPKLVVPIVHGKLNANASRISVGRSSVCDVIVPFSAMSKVHAFVSQTPSGAWEVEDVGSTNGIVLGKTRLTPGTRVPLFDGAELVCGDVTCTFYSSTAFQKLLR